MERKKTKKASNLFIENFKVALNSIKENKLRSTLTVGIIAIGIMSLMGSITATEAIKAELQSSLSQMGSSSFVIMPSRADFSENRTQNKINLSYSQVMAFKNHYTINSDVCIFTSLPINSAVKSSSSDKEMSNANFIASDQYFIQKENAKIKYGRNISDLDESLSSNVCIIGYSVSQELFNELDPTSKVITVSGVGYKIIGSLDNVGSSYGSNNINNSIIIPLSTAKKRYINESSSMTINISPHITVDSETAINEAESVMRKCRRLTPSDISDFRIRTNAQLISESESMIKGVSLAAAAIGFITLLGASIGLMNIMLVSIKERTREIGLRKAIGANSRTIKEQFFLESIIIGQFGCVFGTILGIIIGNVVGMSMESTFIIPWPWLLVSVAVCLFVSITSGFLPARRAALLDPIEALRYE